MAMEISLQALTDKLRSRLEPLEFVDAMFLGGSKAFGRDDEYSDLDMVVQAAPQHIEDVFAAARDALLELSPISVEYRMPEPMWHGMSQTFYQLENAPEWLMVDFCIRQRGKLDGPQFNEIEIHGEPVVIFDKLGCVQPVHVDRKELDAKIREKLTSLRSHYQLFRHLPDKELRRGRPVDAVNFYHQLVLNSLMRILRMRYTPFQYDWGSRYLQHQLPPEVYARLEPLYLVADAADLRRKYRQCREWIEEEFGWWEKEEGTEA